MKTYKENRKRIIERIERIRDEVYMLDRALRQKTASYYIREDEILICDICGRPISRNTAYFLLGNGLKINGVFCDECENGRVED